MAEKSRFSASSHLTALCMAYLTAPPSDSSTVDTLSLMVGMQALREGFDEEGPVVDATRLAIATSEYVGFGEVFR